MSFQPHVHDKLVIADVTYRVAEHPVAPGIPYGQEGRAGIVYCLEAGESSSVEVQGFGPRAALKVFKPRFRLPYLVAQAERIAPFADLPGMAACRRAVLTPQRHAALLRQHPDLTYAVLMPWIEGPTWQEVLLEKRPLAPEQSLALARGLAEVLMGMEGRGIAHCDLSAPNVLLPALAQSAIPNTQSPIRNPKSSIELVDLEGLYAPGMLRPQTLSSGSAGYAHRQAADGLWGPEADRFAGAVLLAEMLGWCDLAVVQAAWGESYFDPQEMQQDCLRYRTLVEALQRTWGEAVATLFERAWRSETLADCPTFGEWLLHLPTVPTTVTSVASPPAADALSLLLARAQRLEKEGDWAGALRSYQEARRAAANPALAVELDQIIAQLEQQRREQGRWEEQARQAQAHMRAGRWGDAGALYEALLREPAPASQRGAWQAALEQCREEVELAGLFAAAERAVAERRWSAAAELLDGIAQRRPDYVHGGRQVRDLRAAVARELARQQKRPTAGALWRALVTGLLAVLVVGGLGLGGWYLYTRWQEEEQQRAIAAATAQAAPWLTVTAQAQGTATVITMEQATEAVPVQATITAQAQGIAPAQASTTFPVLVGTPVPWPAAAILPENADKVRQLARWGDGTVSQLALSPDGQWLAVASSLGIYFYEVRTLKKTRHIPTEDWVLSVAFSLDGQTLGSGTASGKIWLWRVSDGTLLHTLDGHTDWVRSVTFSPDGETLASGSWDNSVRLWRVADGSLLRVLEGHGNSVASVAFSPDGEILASSAGDSTIKLWRVADGALLRTLEGHTSGVWSVVFSPDGQILASGAADNTVRLWRASDGTLLQTLRGHTWPVRSVTFSPDGQTLASASQDNTIRLWQVLDGAFLRSLEGHTDWVWSVVFSRDGAILASGSADNTVRVWQASDGRLLQTLEGRAGTIYGTVFSPDGQMLASGLRDSTVKLWRTADGVFLRALHGHTDAVRSVSFSPDGQILASGSGDNTVKLWRVADGTLLRTLEAHVAWVNCVAFSPDGQTLVSGAEDNTVRVWRVADGTLMRTLEGHAAGVTSVAFSPDGQTLASGAWDNTVRLWQLQEGSLLRVLEGHTEPVTTISFSPDGSLLASGSWDFTVRLWRVADGTLLHTLEGHTKHVNSMAFSPNGVILASGASDRTVRLWEVPAGTLLRVLEGHRDAVQTVTFSPGGQILLSASYDGTTRLWGVLP